MVGIKEAMRILKEGGPAVEAVEVGIRLVEANPIDHSVGYSGFPNILGQVELDAGIMDGSNLTAGAVGAIKGFKHPISIARKVMENMPHVFLVGYGAERFAIEMGFERCELLTPEVKRAWELRLQAEIPDFNINKIEEIPDLWKLTVLATDPEKTAKWMAQKAAEDPDIKKMLQDLRKLWMTKGTVNFIAQDAQGNISTGTSTSGWAGKYPGRLGDSPVIGVGLYADSRYGAAACTGMGEMAIRACTSHSVVFHLRRGLALEEAGRQAMSDLNDLGGPYLSRMNIIAIDKDGRPGAFSNDKKSMYIYLTEKMDKPEITMRTYVETKQYWKKASEYND